MTSEETPLASKEETASGETPLASKEETASGETPLASKEELNAELRALLLRAYESGIDVEGGFECRNGAGPPDWDVIVTEVEKNDRSE